MRVEAARVRRPASPAPASPASVSRESTSSVLVVADPTTRGGPVPLSVPTVLGAGETRGGSLAVTTLSYRELLAPAPPGREADGRDPALVVLCFPYDHWDRHIEGVVPGPYGNAAYSWALRVFLERVGHAVRRRVGPAAVFLNPPGAIARTRNKAEVKRALVAAGVPTPPAFEPRTAAELRSLLDDGHQLYLKAVCGSMGKGITVLTADRWRTTFEIEGGVLRAPAPDPARAGGEQWPVHDLDPGDDRAFDALARAVARGDLLCEAAVEPPRAGGWGELRVTVLRGEVVACTAVGREGPDRSPDPDGERGRATSVPPGPAVTATGRAATRALGLGYAVFDVLLGPHGPQIVDVQAFPALDSEPRTLRRILAPPTPPTTRAAAGLGNGTTTGGRADPDSPDRKRNR
ncbi:MAG: ATP-grasp domain-containing protein [Frankia sp.]